MYDREKLRLRDGEMDLSLDNGQQLATAYLLDSNKTPADGPRSQMDQAFLKPVCTFQLRWMLMLNEC